MPTYSAKSADKSVVQAAYNTASQMTKDPTIMLALFEAAMVESNFHNYKKATDHDSLGYLQQRPSAGWPNPTDIPTATRSFINKAVSKRKQHPTYNAGQLAQAVQVSAYPDRYNQAESAARELLAGASKRGGISIGIPDVLQDGVSGIASGALDKVAEAIRSAASPLISTGKLADQVYKVFMPSNFIRMASGVAGALFLLFGIYLLTKEVR